MNNMVRNSIVYNDIKRVYNDNLSLFEKLQYKTILITGATGLIGSFLIRCLLYANKQSSLNIKIIALVRNKAKAKEHFHIELQDNALKLLVQDVVKPIKSKEKVDYIVHCASNTSSQSFVDYPVETLNTTIEGTKNILEFAKKAKIKGMVYLSSMEVYGELEIDKGPTKEEDLGYIDILKPRSSYQMAKRIAESYCSYYSKEYNVPVKIARLSQIISSSADYNDSRVFAYFARCIVEKKDIVLNTPADVIRSFCYITDAISAILILLLSGENGRTYNVANESAASKIKDIAQNLSVFYPSSKLVFDLKENTIYPATTNWQLDSSSLKSLNWSAKVSFKEMFDSVISSFVKQSCNEIVKNEKFIQKIFSIRNKNGIKRIVFFGMSFDLNIALLNSLRIFLVQLVFGIKNNKIVFSNYMGGNYGCNPKYITEEIIKRKLPYELVWLVKKENILLNKKDFPSNVRIVPYKSTQAFKELATAKIWVDNYHKISFIKKGLTKNVKQFFIQTWHGSLGIKKIEKAVSELTNDQLWLNAAIKSSEMTDFWISNSVFETNVYKNSFWSVDHIKEFGHPRNDIFFDNNIKLVNKIKHKLDLDVNKRIVLYAPSFRDDEHSEYYNLNYDKLIKFLSYKYSGEWVILSRMHHRMKKYSDKIIKKSFNVIDVTHYSDIQELMLVADMLISDYSSCMFDFMLTRKPIFVYATDLDSYKNGRGFYYPIEKTPFSIATNNEELITNIEKFNYLEYKNNVELFLKDKGCMEDGKASKRVVDLIEDIVNEK